MATIARTTTVAAISFLCRNNQRIVTRPEA
jgi:hypothetical protein